MIIPSQGNLLEAQAEALVNTVNTVGVMGRGIALQFQRAFPANYAAYKKACDAGEVMPGKMFIFEERALGGPRWIVNFPTKRHWKGKSRLEDIRDGLADLAEEVQRLGIRSLAMPPLGCGLGGLDWAQVRPLIESAFSAVPEVQVLLFAPEGAPAAAQMPNKTKRPNMTAGRAAVIGLLGRYAEMGYRLALLEVQKLSYFLQVVGEPLRLEFRPHHYGPYADKLRQVLNCMEGHFTTGYGDGNDKPDTPIRLLPDSLPEAESFLEKQPETHERFERVLNLIEGFETPHGLELLSTVHWLASVGAGSVSEVMKGLSDWSERKFRSFTESQVAVAFERLKQNGLVAA
jgi:O-acetyl-ADP-ribose deacetylase (regulator of RNase III)